MDTKSFPIEYCRNSKPMIGKIDYLELYIFLNGNYYGHRSICLSRYIFIAYFKTKKNMYTIRLDIVKTTKEWIAQQQKKCVMWVGSSIGYMSNKGKVKLYFIRLY